MFAGPLDEAKVLIMRGQIDPAIQRLSEFLNDDFFHDEALFMLGGALMSKGMNGLAAVITSAAVDARAAKKRPFPEALLNLGAAYKAENQYETAMRIWLDALKQEPLPRERAKILTNISALFLHEAQSETVIEWADRAIAADPAAHGARANRGIACLELGRWREGWEGWKSAYVTGDRTLRRYGKLPQWDGTPGQHVIAWGEQGMGDEIFYASCLRDLKRVCRKVTLDCHPRLPDLFAASFPEITVHGTRKDLTELPWFAECDADAAVSLADLPGFFRNDGEWDGLPYLIASPSLAGHKLRIGLSWTGGDTRTRKHLRSLPLTALEPVIRARPDAEWYSLQYTPEAAREVCELEERTGIRVAHFPGHVECYDYNRTARFVASMDLVISVCTTVHHLAGALGIPVWTLVPQRCSWRYAGNAPWYGSAKLFRQDKDGEWSGPVDRIARALADFG